MPGAAVRARALVLAGLSLASLACGKKAPPERPLEPSLPLPRGIAVTQRGADLRLAWTLVLPEGERRETTVRECVVEALRLPPDPALEWEENRRRILEAVGRGEVREIGRVAVDLPGREVAGLPMAFTDPGAAAGGGVEVLYRVIARTDAKNRGASSPVVWVRAAPPPPTPAGVAVEPREDEVLLRVSPGDGTPEGALWRIYRTAPGAAEPWDPLAVQPLPSPSASDRTAEIGRDYEYRAAALVRQPDSVRVILKEDAEAAEPLDAVALASTRAEGAPRPLDAESVLSPAAPLSYRDVFPPATPGGLRVLVEGSRVVLFWDPDDEPDLAGYRVFRREGDDGEWTAVGEGVSEAIWRDDATRPGAAYSYTVSAVDRSVPPNESPRAAPVQIAVPSR